MSGSATSQCGVSPGVVNADVDAFDGHLLGTSPAIDGGTGADAPADDLEGRARDATPDIGAYEHWEPVAWVYLPTVLRGPR